MIIDFDVLRSVVFSSVRIEKRLNQVFYVFWEINKKNEINTHISDFGYLGDLNWRCNSLLLIRKIEILRNDLQFQKKKQFNTGDFIPGMLESLKVLYVISILQSTV